MTVKISTLDNGLRVVSERNPNVQSVSLGVWVDVGARYEPESLHGISHLLEHMMFKGTGRRTATRISEEIEAVGGHLNAYTSREHTSYYARVLKDDIELALDLLSDILLNSRFDDRELAREKEVVLQEIGQVEDTPDDIVFDALQSTAYPKQSLGRPILGTEASIAAITADDICTYMAPHYTAGNMILVAAGNVDHETLVSLAGTYFSSLKAGADSSFEQAAYRGGDARTRRDLEQLHMALGFESYSYRDPAYFAGQVYTTILGGGMSSRLFQEIREKRGFAYSVYAFNASLSDSGLLSIYAGTGPEYVHDMIPLVAREMKALAGAILEDEIARAKAQLKSGLLMALESTSARIEQIGRQMLIFGRPLSLEELVDKVEAVDRRAINSVAEHILGSPLTAASIGQVGTVPDFNDLVKGFSPD